MKSQCLLVSLLALTSTSFAASPDKALPYFPAYTIGDHLYSDSSLKDGSYLQKKYGVEDVNVGFFFSEKKSCEWKDMTVWGKQAKAPFTFNPLDKDGHNYIATMTSGKVYITISGHPNGVYDYLEECDGNSLYQLIEKIIASFNDQKNRTATLAGIDFDVETGAFTQGTGWKKIGYAMDKLQSQHKNLKISITIPGLTSNGWDGFKQGYKHQELKEFMHKYGGQIDHINVMSFHFGNIASSLYLSKTQEAMTNVYHLLSQSSYIGNALAKNRYHPMISVSDVNDGLNNAAVIQIRDWNKNSGYGGISVFNLYDDMINPQYKQPNFYKLIYESGISPSPSPSPIPDGKPGEVIIINQSSDSISLRLTNQSDKVIDVNNLQSKQAKTLTKSTLPENTANFKLAFKQNDEKIPYRECLWGEAYNQSWAPIKIIIKNNPDPVKNGAYSCIRQ